MIVCMQKPSHHFLQTFRHYACLRLCSAIVRFIRNDCLYFVCNGWSAQISPKRWFGKHGFDVTNNAHQRQMTPYATEWNPLWKFSVYATGHVTGVPLHLYIQITFLRKMQFSWKVIFRKLSFSYQIPDQNSANLKTSLTKS